MRRLLPVVALGLVLAGCSESAEDVRADYCETVKDQQFRLSDVMAEKTPTTLLEALPVFRDLAAEAPGDITDDWSILIDAIEGLQGALDEAGVDPATYDPAKPPDDLTRDQQASIERAAAGLLDPRTDEAFQAVDQQARDVCRTPLYQ